MIQRHRTPSIFSIYMVDVLCCALGCVVLLWQVNHYEAEENSASAKIALAQLQNAKLNIDLLGDEAKQLKTKLDASRLQETQVSLMLDKTRIDLAQAQKLALVYLSDYEAAKKAEAMTRGILQKLQKAFDLTKLELADRSKKNEDLAGQLAKLLEELQRKNLDLLAAVEKMDQQSSAQKALQSQFANLSAAGKKAQSEADLRVRSLEKDLALSRVQLLDSTRKFQDILQARDLLDERVLAMTKDRELLLQQNLSIKKAAENRFAGITLTGQRVLFLVDMSGSMELLDYNTVDPDKWPLVCEAIGKLMRSLSDVKQFQVILFSDKVRYPLGNERRWMEYIPKHSADGLVDSLKAIKPKGETNMFAAFDEAFQFRDQGLDTIYVISDGLPNAGDGLPADAKSLTEAQRTEALARRVRTQLKSVWNNRQPRVRINTVGFFFESPDVGAFLWALARENDGSFVGMSKP